MRKYLKHNARPDTPVLNQITKRPPPPAEYEPLYQFRRSALAKYVGVKVEHLCNIFSGYREPSQKIHDKLIQLAQDVQNELRLSEAGLLDTVSGENGGLN